MSTFMQVLLSGLLVGGIYALVTVGVTFVFGVINVVNFAHGEFVMLGGYFAWLMSTLGVNLVVSLLISVPLAFLAGAVLQRFLIQPLQGQQLMQIFATFGLLLLLQNIVLLATVGESKSIQGTYASAVVSLTDEIRVSVPRLVVFLVATALTVGLIRFLRDTVTGTAIRAISQDRQTGRLMGINVERLYTVTMGIGITLAVVAGVLVAPAFALTPTIGFSFMLPAFVAAVLGGFGSVLGAYLGGLLVGVLEGLVGYYINPSLAQAVVFLLLIVVLVVRPWGLFGSRAQAERAVL